MTSLTFAQVMDEFNRKFFEDQSDGVTCGTILAAKFLEMEELTDLLCARVCWDIRLCKTPDEIRDRCLVSVPLGFVAKRFALPLQQMTRRGDWGQGTKSERISRRRRSARSRATTPGSQPSKRNPHSMNKDARRLHRLSSPLFLSVRPSP